MIEKMLKAYCVARARDRERFLDALASLGVIHLSPVDPKKAVADEEILSALDRLKRALQVLESVEPDGTAPACDPVEAAGKVLAIQRDSAERRSRLAALWRQLEALKLWGDVRREQFEELKEAGISLRFFVVSEKDLADIQAECVEVVGQYPGRKLLVAVASRAEEPQLPGEAQELAIPRRDRPSLKAEAAEIDRALTEDMQRLRSLAASKDAIKAAISELEEKAAVSVAVRGALSEDELFALQGWVPASRAEHLAEGLAQQGIEAAVQCFEPPEGEQPPTLLRYPRWAQPIKALFEILNTVPGYRELDLSPFFMIALPLFAAILIGDAGYGLVFLAGGGLLYRRAVKARAAAKIHLLLVIGAVTFLWGLGTGGFFGLGPLDLATSGGIVGQIGYAWNRIALVGVSTDALREAVLSGDTKQVEGIAAQTMEHLRTALIQVSFILAALHLVLARVREAVGLWPDQRALASVGWAGVLVGIFGIIWYLFFGRTSGGALSPVWVYCVGAGWVTAVLFAAPSPNPLKRIFFGLASCLLPVMDSFSNTMSYIRLMAVSLASVYIAQVFNMLGAKLAGVATWFAGAPIVVFGHALNIGLCVVAIFAHGVRLNMLEFSSNAGVQWAGYPFRPFVKSSVKES